jgi:hypothetical protein
MTEQEKEILQWTGELWNKFIQLPIMHPDDQNEFRFHLHAIQNIVYAREGVRSVEPVKGPRETVEVPADIGSTRTSTGK